MLTRKVAPYLSVEADHQGLILHSIYHRPNGWDYLPPGRAVPPARHAVLILNLRSGGGKAERFGGTRNHLAMDLGLDRGDVVGALDAFGAARERAVDVGEVNGRVFVNTVSLGLYAEIIRSPQYRDAKLDTTLSALPRLLGPANSR